MAQLERYRRLWSFLLTTFLITWTCWWSLAWLARAGSISYGQPLFMVLYLLGGFGPTIAAYVSVLATRREAPVSEYHSRLFRWRIGLLWYVIAFTLPFVMAFIAVRIARTIEPFSLDQVVFKPWAQIVPLFLTMVIGGGLEELGWRGVAQPELERKVNRASAAFVIGIAWSAWHLPLFSIPGVGQYGTSFPIYAVGVVGQAFILAWLYARTGSILLCLIFHAAVNTAAAMGLVVPTNSAGPALAGALLPVIVGVALLLTDRWSGSGGTPASRARLRRVIGPS